MGQSMMLLNMLSHTPEGRYSSTICAQKKKILQNISGTTTLTRALHSQKAYNILKSFPIIGQQQKTQCSIEYLKLRQKVIHLYKPNWLIQSLLITTMITLLFIGSFTQSWIIAFFALLLPQLTGGWMAHSMNHSRDPTLKFIGTLFGTLCCGFSTKWWSPKHNMHHMFTNSLRYDDDIKHSYNPFLYPFLWIKWRFDSIVAAFCITHFEFSLILIHYIILLHQNVIPILLALLVDGLFAAYVLIGNHEKQKRWQGMVQVGFVDHQLVSTRNYPYKSILSMILMGGMQYQTEHHLFPQIPFYNLPKASRIIEVWLKEQGKQVKWDSIL